MFPWDSLSLFFAFFQTVPKKVTIARAQRNKKKYVTVVSGLATFGECSAIFSLLDILWDSEPASVIIPWSQRCSFAMKTQEREKSDEKKPLVVNDVNLTNVLWWVSINITRLIHKQPITTHLSVNNSQSEYAIRFLQSGGRVRSWP